MCFEAHARVIRRFVDHLICFASRKYFFSQLVSLNSGVTTAAGRDAPMWCLLPAGLDKLGLEAGG